MFGGPKPKVLTDFTHQGGISPSSNLFLRPYSPLGSNRSSRREVADDTQPEPVRSAANLGTRKEDFRECETGETMGQVSLNLLPSGLCLPWKEVTPFHRD